jgi:hypothetical protein
LGTLCVLGGISHNIIVPRPLKIRRSRNHDFAADLHAARRGITRALYMTNLVSM